MNESEVAADTWSGRVIKTLGYLNVKTVTVDPATGTVTTILGDSMDMFDEILRGGKPSAVFRRILHAEPELDNWELASRFKEHFDRVDSFAQQVIWRWQRPGGKLGMQDKEVDRRLIELLEIANYAIRRGGAPSL